MNIGNRISILRNTLIAALVFGAAGIAHAFPLWPFDLRGPSLYVIHGYLDQAPKGTPILDQIEIAAAGKHRNLLVTWYGTPGETSLDRHLSRVMARPYTIRGEKDLVDHLASAPAGTQIDGKFAAYTEGPPWLLIADLEFPTDEPKNAKSAS